jgi:hypothetical protein
MLRHKAHLSAISARGNDHACTFAGRHGGSPSETRRNCIYRGLNSASRVVPARRQPLASRVSTWGARGLLHCNLQGRASPAATTRGSCWITSGGEGGQFRRVGLHESGVKRVCSSEHRIGRCVHRSDPDCSMLARKAVTPACPTGSCAETRLIFRIVYITRRPPFCTKVAKALATPSARPTSNMLSSCRAAAPHVP